MSRVDSLVERMLLVRSYTGTLLENIRQDDWFRQPQEGVTHLAWQVGHLAVAQYHLTFVRVRGKQPEDLSLIPEEFASLFGRGSVPSPDKSRYPDPYQLLDVLHRVHERAIEQIRALPETALDEPVEPPHPMFNTKGGALQWCAFHEILHAGQIGLLRRLFGYEPLR